LADLRRIRGRALRAVYVKKKAAENGPVKKFSLQKAALRGRF
jgi:hypothetical protein